MSEQDKKRQELAKKLAADVTATLKAQGKAARASLENLQQLADEQLLLLELAAGEPGYEKVLVVAGDTMMLRAAGLAIDHADAADRESWGLVRQGIVGALAIALV